MKQTNQNDSQQLLLTNELSKHQAVSGNDGRRLTDPMVPRKPTPDMYDQLYRQMRQLYDYTYDRLDKFPKVQKLPGGLVPIITGLTNYCLESTIETNLYNPKVDKEQLLRKMSVKLKVLMVVVETCCRKHCISHQNREAWSRMIAGLDNLVIGLAMGIEKNHKAPGHKGLHS